MSSRPYVCWLLLVFRFAELFSSFIVAVSPCLPSSNPLCMCYCSSLPFSELNAELIAKADGA